MFLFNIVGEAILYPMILPIIRGIKVFWYVFFITFFIYPSTQYSKKHFYHSCLVPLCVRSSFYIIVIKPMTHLPKNWFIRRYKKIYFGISFVYSCISSSSSSSSSQYTINLLKHFFISFIHALTLKKSIFKTTRRYFSFSFSLSPSVLRERDQGDTTEKEG